MKSSSSFVVVAVLVLAAVAAVQAGLPDVGKTMSQIVAEKGYPIQVRVFDSRAPRATKDGSLT